MLLTGSSALVFGWFLAEATELRSAMEGAPCGARTIAIRTSSGTPRYFNSASTDGKVSKLHLDVFIFSMMRAGGSLALTIVRMSAFLNSTTELSWASQSAKQVQMRRVRANKFSFVFIISHPHTAPYAGRYPFD